MQAMRQVRDRLAHNVPVPARVVSTAVLLARGN